MLGCEMKQTSRTEKTPGPNPQAGDHHTAHVRRDAPDAALRTDPPPNGSIESHPPPNDPDVAFHQINARVASTRLAATWQGLDEYFSEQQQGN